RHGEEIKSFAGEDSGLIGNAENAWSVAFIDDDEDLSPSGLNRTIKIAAVDTLADVVPRIAPYKTLLQTVGIAAPPAELYELSAALGLAGVTRI
ncbi:MAG: acyl-CoA reductase, partial [Alphaproteobacteria bacterium]